MSVICKHMLFVANRIVAARKTFLPGIVLLLVSGCAVMAPAEKEVPKPRDLTVHVTIKDGQGRPLKDAVVYAVQKERVAPTDRRKTVIVIANSAFQRVVQPVQVGSLITFQNRDRVQHHIYSISAAKKIDVPLKKGASSRPIRLNKAGVVVLGCAIHDPMFGYLYAVETAHFASGRITGVEALIRWRHPQHGFIPPDEFIPLSEGTGLIKPVTFWALKTAIRHCAQLFGQGIHLTVAINLSARVLPDHQLPDAIASFIDEFHLSPLQIERQRTLDVITRLDSLGVQMVIDDFGTAIPPSPISRTFPSMRSRSTRPSYRRWM